MVKNPPANAGDVRTLEEGMATDSSILAGRIPWTKEPGELQSRESHRIGHDWNNSAFMHIFDFSQTHKILICKYFPSSIQQAY